MLPGIFAVTYLLVCHWSTHKTTLDKYATSLCVGEHSIFQFLSVHLVQYHLSKYYKYWDQPFWEGVSKKSISSDNKIIHSWYSCVLFILVKCSIVEPPFGYSNMQQYLVHQCAYFFTHEKSRGVYFKFFMGRNYRKMGCSYGCVLAGPIIKKFN